MAYIRGDAWPKSGTLNSCALGPAGQRCKVNAVNFTEIFTLHTEPDQASVVKLCVDALRINNLLIAVCDSSLAIHQVVQALQHSHGPARLQWSLSTTDEERVQPVHAQ